MKFVKKLFLFLSAFVPLYFLLIVKILIDIMFGDLHFNVLNSLSLGIYTAAMVLGIWGAISALKHKGSKPTTIVIVEKQSLTEQYFLGYFSLFVLFALSFEIEKVSMFVVFVAIIALIGIVYIKNDMFYINPFLNLLGYNFYQITFTYPDNDKPQIAKFLFKGKLDITKNHKAKFSHENFSIILN